MKMDMHTPDLPIHQKKAILESYGVNVASLESQACRQAHLLDQLRRCKRAREDLNRAMTQVTTDANLQEQLYMQQPP